MLTVAIVIGAAVMYLVAYHTYGRWLARKIFQLDPDAVTPAVAKDDGVDYVPTRKEVIFGHHFTSIAGTGPIVGPALAVFWGWLPALLWVLIGSVVMGAVHDFGALVISMRNDGKSVGDIIGDLVNPRVRVLFFLVIFFALLIVIAIFGLVIAVLFARYPESIFPVWFEIPLAILVGWIILRRPGRSLLGISIVAVAVMYVTVWIGASYGHGESTPLKALSMAYASAKQSGDDPAVTKALRRARDAVAAGEAQKPVPPVDDPDALIWAGVTGPEADATKQKAILLVKRYTRDAGPLHLNFGKHGILIWTVILLVYAFIASILPVHTLLQPRDFINSHQLLVAMGLVVIAMLWTHPGLDMGLFWRVSEVAGDKSAPPFFPFLFITIACGAISGFHCLVSSGTTSKQIRCEPDAQFVGYGSMLTEGMLATLVILACTAGLAFGAMHFGAVPFADRYASWDSIRGIGPKVGAFVDGAAYMIGGALLWTGLDVGTLIPLATTVMGVFVVSFAATTLDTATRLQRYVITELAETLHVKPLTNRYAATAVAVVTAGILALWDGVGKGAMLLWPLFGTVNQLLASLGLLTITIWLYRRGKPTWFTVVPMLFMVVMTGLAMILLIKDRFLPDKDYHLLAIGCLIFALEIWMLVESTLVWLNLRQKPVEARLEPAHRRG